MKSISVKPNRHLKRNLIIAAILVVIAGGGAFAYYKATTPVTKEAPTKSDTTIDHNPPTKEEQQAGDSQKQAIIDKDKSPATTPSSITVTITAANQNGNVLNIRSLIGTVTSTGSCHLTLTKGEAVVAKTSGIQALADSSTCKGFDIPTSELAKGTWHAVLTVTSNNVSGKAEQDIVIN
jgi:hypothetical protein